MNYCLSFSRQIKFSWNTIWRTPLVSIPFTKYSNYKGVCEVVNARWCRNFIVYNSSRKRRKRNWRKKRTSSLSLYSQLWPPRATAINFPSHLFYVTTAAKRGTNGWTVHCRLSENASPVKDATTWPRATTTWKTMASTGRWDCPNRIVDNEKRSNVNNCKYEGKDY